MIQIIFITALIVFFFHAITWEGMIFSFVSRFFKTTPDYIKKPLFACPVCMTIWWAPSIIAVGIAGNAWQIDNVYQLSIIVTASAGVNTFFTYIVSFAKSFIKEDCCTTRKKPTREEIKARRKRIYQIQTQSA